jgi:hypothetical protein
VQNQQYKIMHFKKQITERKRKKTVNNQNCYTIQDCASLQSQVVTFLYCDISFDTRWEILLQYTVYTGVGSSSSRSKGDSQEDVLTWGASSVVG